MFPFHTWLPDAHVEAPTAGSVILAGVLLKMGTYGFLRFNLPFFPQASYEFVPMVAWLSIIGIIYGALVAMVQEDLKKLVAYSSVSHLGFIMLGIFALNPYGIQGALIQNINHGISTSALFLLVGVVYDRRHTRLISEFGGLAKIMPKYTVCFMIVALSSIGLPGMNGFVGEFLVLLGIFQVNGLWAGLCHLWRHSSSLLHSMDVPTSHVSGIEKSKKHRYERYEYSGNDHHRSFDRFNFLDWSVSQYFHEDIRRIGQSSCF